MTAGGLRAFVAIGDSQTEGLLDPDGRGGYRGWADRLAEHLAARDPAVQYANLAVRGRRLAQIRAEQLGPAQAMAPDLVTVMGGLNDVLRPDFEPGAALADLDALLAGFPDATVVTNTFPDLGEIAPLFRRLAPRVHGLNDGIRRIARERGALVVDFAERGVGTDARIWSPDRIHANPVGHALIAAAFADTLGIDGFADWDAPLPPASPRGAVGRSAAEVRWVVGAVVPWLWRRARGRSSGDGITAKRPQLGPVAPVFHLVDPATWQAGGYRPASLDGEGFVHLSFGQQVAGSADRHFADAPALVALELDGSRLDAPVVVEDSYGSGTSFPHLYGELRASAVLAVHPLSREPGGGWRFSGADATAAASPDR